MFLKPRLDYAHFNMVAMVSPEGAFWLRGVGLGGVDTIHWNVYNKELYLTFLGTHNCLAQPTIYDSSVLSLNYALVLTTEFFRRRSNTLVFFLNVPGNPHPLPRFEDFQFFRYNLALLNTWHPGYLSNHFSYAGLLGEIGKKGWHRSSRRLKRT